MLHIALMNLLRLWNSMRSAWLLTKCFTSYITPRFECSTIQPLEFSFHVNFSTAITPRYTGP